MNLSYSQNKVAILSGEKEPETVEEFMWLGYSLDDVKAINAQLDKM